MNEISEFICSVPYISDLQKDFYKTYIEARFEKIILPAHEQVFEQKNDIPTMSM